MARESASGSVVGSDGAPLAPSDLVAARQAVWMYRELPDEIDVPFSMPVLYQDERIVVVDKPHFLATMPRGARVVQSALVRLRRELDDPRLAPAHRLDRLTAGCCCSPATRRCGEISAAVRGGRRAQGVRGAGAAAPGPGAAGHR
ncbi:hypothetical protein [Tsukamurella sp. PLM1]|uniref:hypothetical protein n=1 Tax=Tsukamurella sp. PLM1 TaxID=2929795 RepID=UPI00204BC858|nr:hypothetical protein [Tsukamurella sp. PLM1]BDH59584.1 hypothetical protein MTP03_45230 [Tsukamurella sp. PLM1]